MGRAGGRARPERVLRRARLRRGATAIGLDFSATAAATATAAAAAREPARPVGVGDARLFTADVVDAAPVAPRSGPVGASRCTGSRRGSRASR